MIRGQIWTVSRLEYAGQCRDNLDSGINKPTRTVGWRHLGALELLPWRKDETETNIVLAGPDAECTYTWYLCTNMCQRTLLMLMGSVHQMGKGSALRGNLCTYVLGIYYILNA
jgi:hypothetical protein